MKLNKYTDSQTKKALYWYDNDSVSAQGSQEHHLMTSSREKDRMRKLAHALQNKKIVGSPKSNQPKQKLLYFRPSQHSASCYTSCGTQELWTRSGRWQMSFHWETNNVQVCSVLFVEMSCGKMSCDCSQQSTHSYDGDRLLQQAVARCLVCRSKNIPIPYLVYVSPNPGTKGWQSIKKNIEPDMRMEKNI